MNALLSIIRCCRNEDIIKNQTESGINVPIDNNKNSKNNSPEKQESKLFESSNIKSTEMNNTIILNDNNNNSNHYASMILEDNSNINNLNNNTINYTNINNNQNTKPNQTTINKVDTFAIQNKEEISSSSPVKKINYSHILTNNHMNINKIVNNNNNNINKSIESKKNMSTGSISKINAKNGKDKMSNKDTILTLNDLVLINQNQEEKVNEIGSKLLLSGELFFWKEIIIQTNGIKNSLRKEKDDHVFFGLKNKSNYAGILYNDFIINFFWHQDDAEVIETNTGRVFEIYYNKKTKDYTLKFLHPNLILYYKINNFVYFNTGKEYYLLLGNVFMTINVRKSSPIEKTIIIQIEIENNKPVKYSFNQNQTPIKIGRINNSEIPIFSTSISKRHGIIEYSKNSHSFYYKDMGSTNSSTLLIKDGDNLKIKGEMNFKLEDVPFKVQEIP